MGNYYPQVRTAAAVLLEHAYERAQGGFVAFLDESFELDESSDRSQFYMLSAVVVHRDDLVDLRAGARKVVDGTYWHTTDELKTPGGRDRAQRFAEFLGDPEGNEVAVVAIKAPVSSGEGDAARAACFEEVGRLLCSGGGLLTGGGVHLMVLEQRRTQRNRSFDSRIVKDLRKNGTICRRCQLIQVSPKDEHLLWLPDLVSSAVRRHHLGQIGDVDLHRPLARILHVSNCP